ncbi:PAS domain-containing sensor histidine kinase [Curvibacter gracilis]|uniref:PAS domain-containing sensor histidine kinase n=1 Tax=Curvibacter gracilis TaxID=230310 RepID=UPI0004AF1004|nr:PAS domain S-box protein [Curvibacter gracilis]
MAHEEAWMFDADAAMDLLRADLAKRHLQRLAWLVACSALLMGLSQWIAQVPPSSGMPGPIAALIGSAATLLCLRRAAWRAAAWCLWLGVMAWVSCSAAFTALDRSLLAGAYILIGALSGWMLGRRTMLLSMLLSLGAMLALELQGLGSFAELPVLALQRTVAGWVLAFGLGAYLFYQVFRDGEQQLIGLALARQRYEARSRHFENIAEHVPSMLSHWGPDRRCLWVNQRYARALGLRPEQLVGRSIEELWDEGICNTMRPLIDRVLRGEEVREEISVPRGEEQPRMILLHLIPERAGATRQTEGDAGRGLDQGEVIGWFGQMRDITRQHRQAQLVLESRQRWRLAVEVAGLIYWELDRASGLVRWGTDDEAPANTPISPLASLVSPWDWADFCRQFIHPQDQSGVAKAVEEAWGSGLLNTQYRLVAPTGELQWALVRAQVVHDPAGARMVGVWQNITAAELAREALVLSETRLQALLDNTPAVAVQQYDLQGRVLYWNNASEQLFGISSARAMGQTLSALVPGWADDSSAGHAQWRLAFEQLCHEGPPKCFELGINTAEGEPRWQLCSLFRLPEFDGQVRLVCMGIDITERHRAEEALRALQQGFESAFYGSPTPARIFSTHDFGHTLACNDALCRLVGHTREQLLSHNIRDLNLHADTQARDRLLQRLQSDGRIEGMEMDLRHPSGAIRTVLTYMLPVSWQGQAAWQSQLVDITERKRTEEELRNSRRLLERVVDAIPMGIFVKDTASNYLLVNQWMASFMGTTKQQLLQHTNALPVGERVRSKSLDDDEWVYQHRQTLVQPEAELAGPDGVMVPFHSVKIPLFDEAGELTGLLGVNRSIVEEKRAQATLQASERRLALLFQDSPAALAVIGDDGLYYDVNRSWLRLFGYAPEQVVGHGSHEFGLFVSTHDRDRLYETLRRDGAVDELEIALRHRDGRVLDCVASGRTLDLEGMRSYLFGIVDISDQRRARQQMEQMNHMLEAAVAQRTQALTQTNQELTEAMASLHSTQDELLRSEKHAALGRMVAGVAHELNTPIGNSVLVATTLRSEVEQFGRVASQGLTRSGLALHVSQTAEAVAMLLKNLSRAADLISTFKQVAADQTSLQRRQFMLDEVVREILQMHQPTLRRGSLQVVAQVPAGLRFDSYPGPLGQVLLNLLSNAIEHAYEDLPAGEVLISAQDLPQGRVRLEVRDQGRGMSADTLRRIFDPFYTTRLGRGGTGLGLAICQTLVTRVLGGSITVQSEPGQGTCFSIELPLEAPVVGTPGLVDLPEPALPVGDLRAGL